jgi:hypothetical protein
VLLRAAIETGVEPGEDGRPECRADLCSEDRCRDVWAVVVDTHRELADVVVQQSEVPDIIGLVADSRRSEDRDCGEFLSDLGQLPLELRWGIVLADDLRLFPIAGQRIVPSRLLHSSRLAGIPRGSVKLSVLAK